jgi:hypothetical protein
MYLLGHLGIGLGLAWTASRATRQDVDYRLVLLGSILPDLVDKPLGLALNLESRLWAHTLVFLGTVLAMSAIPRVRRLVFLGIGVATHLLLDRMWENPFVAVWPALGLGFPVDGGVDLWGILEVLWKDPIVLGGEIVGLVVIVLFARAHGIRSWSSLKAFLANGRAGEITEAV